MIRQGIDLVASGDIGKAAMALLVNKQLPAGTLLIELIYGGKPIAKRITAQSFLAANAYSSAA